MMRKKLTNKSKFQFKEEEMLPPAGVPSRGSVQSRLTRKADNKPAYNPTVPSGHAQPIRQFIYITINIIVNLQICSKIFYTLIIP